MNDFVIGGTLSHHPLDNRSAIVVTIDDTTAETVLMECTILALIACFSWSNLYIDGGVHWQDRGHTQVNGVQLLPPNGPRDGAAQSLAPIEWTITYEPANPYGWIGVGYVFNPDDRLQFNLRLGAHRSSLRDGDDRGYKYAGLDFQWFPLRRRR